MMVSAPRLAILAAGTLTLCTSHALAQGCVDYRERSHCPGSNSTLQVVNGTLIVSCPDKTPLATVTTTADRNFGARYEPIHFEHDRSNGFAVANVGTANSYPNQTLGNLYFIYEPGANTLEVTGSSPLTADGINIEIRNQGVVVGTAFNFDGTITASTIGEPAVIETGMITAQPPYSLVARFERAVEWSVESTRAVGDELVFIPAGRVDRIDSLEFATVEGIFIPAFTIIDEYGVRLRTVGSCPGSMQFAVSGASRSGTVALVYAFSRGLISIPSGPCAGTTLGLDRTATLARTARADSTGSALFSAMLPPPACGRVVVQAIDGATCATSNVELIE